MRKPSLESHTECVFSLMKFTKGNSHVLLFMQDIAPYHAVCNTMEAIHSAVIETIVRIPLSPKLKQLESL